MLPFWQHLFPNKSQQVFFLLEIDVVSQNCKTQNTLSVQLVIPEQFQTPPGRSFRTLLISITSLKMLSIQRPLPSILIWTPWSFNAPVNALPVYSTNIRIRVKEKVLLSWNQEKLVFGKYIFMGSTSPFLSNQGVSINFIKDFPSQIPYYYIIHQLKHPKFFSLFFLVFFDSIGC